MSEKRDRRTDIVQVRKKGGIHKMKTAGKNGQTVSPKLFNQDLKNPKKDGNYVEDWEGGIMGTKRGLCPMWSDLKKQWSFSGDAQLFVELVKKMALRYNVGHEKEGQLIKPEAKDFESYLRDIKDPVFTNKALYGRFWMTGGSIGLTKNIPEHHFLYLCLKGDRAVDDRSDDKPKSSYTQAGTQLELISPQKETAAKNKSLRKDITAIKFLDEIDGQDEKIRAICSVMNVSGYSENIEVTQAFNLLYDRVVTNTNMSQKYGMSPQARFVQLSEKTDEELNTMSKVIVGVRKGFLRRHKGYYLFQGARIDAIENDVQLIEYFTNPKNQEDYLKLLDLLNT